MTETPKKTKVYFQQGLMSLLSENLNKEFTASGLAAQFGCSEASISPCMRRLRGHGWDVIRTGNGRYLCRTVGSLAVTSGASEALPFMPKGVALREAAPTPTPTPAPASPAATPSGINVGDLLEVSHVTRQGVMVAMDATGNAYKVQPL